MFKQVFLATSAVLASLTLFGLGVLVVLKVVAYVEWKTNMMDTQKRKLMQVKPTPNPVGWKEQKEVE